MSILDNALGLWWVAVWATGAALTTLVGAMRGASRHRTPRLMLGVALVGIAVSYWWELSPGSLGGPAEMRRGAGMVLWPALMWAAWSGITYARRQDKTAQIVLDAYREGSSDE